MSNIQDTLKELPRKFHEAYERLAPTFGYETREDTKEFDADSPNGKLMGAVVNEVMTKALEDTREEAVTGETSDGFHTFNELYEFRKLYNAGLFNEWAKQGLFNVHKSKKHSDGEECFGGGWFIVTATLPTGQISNHYDLKDWDLFQVEDRELADVWDCHTPQDVAHRLEQFLKGEE